MDIVDKLVAEYGNIAQLGIIAGAIVSFLGILFKSRPEKILDTVSVKFIRVIICEIIALVFLGIILLAYPIYIFNSQKISELLMIISISSYFIILVLNEGILSIQTYKLKFIKTERRRLKVIEILNYLKRKKVLLTIIHGVTVATYYIAFQSFILSYFNNILETSFRTGIEFIISTIKDYSLYIKNNPNDTSIQDLSEIKNIYISLSLSFYLLIRLLFEPIKQFIINRTNNYSVEIMLNNGLIFEDYKLISSNNEVYVLEKKTSIDYIVIHKSDVRFIRFLKNND